MAGVVEQHSIDVVPDAERHGTAFSQFTLWLGVNLQITAVVTRGLAVVFGGGAFWSVIGLLTGNLLGGAVMALHSAQGPRLGLPQMISSRAQFGVRGAVVPLALVIVMYIGFFASGSVLAGQAVGELTHLGDTTGIVVFALATAVIVAVAAQRPKPQGGFGEQIGNGDRHAVIVQQGGVAAERGLPPAVGASIPAGRVRRRSSGRDGPAPGPLSPVRPAVGCR